MRSCGQSRDAKLFLQQRARPTSGHGIKGTQTPREKRHRRILVATASDEDGIRRAVALWCIRHPLSSAACGGMPSVQGAVRHIGLLQHAQTRCWPVSATTVGIISPSVYTIHWDRRPDSDAWVGVSNFAAVLYKNGSTKVVLCSHDVCPAPRRVLCAAPFGGEGTMCKYVCGGLDPGLGCRSLKPASRPARATMTRCVGELPFGGYKMGSKSVRTVG